MMRMRFVVRAAVATARVLALALACAACTPLSQQLNPPLDGYDVKADHRYDWAHVIGTTDDATATANDPRDDTFIIVTLSGGGTRAAAFGYGVLQELAHTPTTGGRDLLDDVDVLSSVSGGSFASAYYGLFGRQQFFARFREDVLYRNLEGGIAARVFAPWNWPRLLSPSYSRSDLAAEYYDAAIFHDKTFADLEHRRPFIVLNATDIARGAQFSFIQEHFDRLCSDLSPVHVARGVTASSAFPVAFPPLTLKNYGAGWCGYEAPSWVWGAEERAFDDAPQQWDLARTWRTYEDAGRRPYIHLSDGGLADNIGLRAAESNIEVTGLWDVLGRVNLGAIRKFVVIVVDAKPRTDACIDQSPHAPIFPTVLNAAATTPMENYSSDTVERFRRWFDDNWTTQLRDFHANQARCTALACEQCGPTGRACVEARRRQCDRVMGLLEPPHDVALYEIHVRFDAIPDCSQRTKLAGIGTRLHLPRDQVNALIDWGGHLLRSAPAFQRLVDDLRHPPAPPLP